MLLKTVYQWDIYTQEDLATFRQNSGVIHRNVERVIYRSDHDANPGQREEKQTTPSDNSRRQTRRRTSQQVKRRSTVQNRDVDEISYQPPVQEQDADELSEAYPNRERFLDRLARDLEHRRQHGKGAEYEGYGIVVKAVVEHRDGRAVRAPEFVETEGLLLAHLLDPNQGRILSGSDHKPGLFVEDPEGNIRLDQSFLRQIIFPCKEECSAEARQYFINTIELMIRQDLDRKDRWLMQWLLDAGKDEFPEKTYEKMQRERLAKQFSGRKDDNNPL